MKNKIKKTLKQIAMLSIAFTAGISVFMGALYVNAAFNDDKSSSDKLLSAEWNAMVDQIQAWTRTNGADTIFGTDDDVVYLTSGQVGIGVSAPTHTLDVATAAGNAEIGIKSAGATDHWGIYQDATDSYALKFWNGDNKLTIKSDGGIVVSKTTPTSADELATKAYVDAAGSGGSAGDWTCTTITGNSFTSSVGSQTTAIATCDVGYNLIAGGCRNATSGAYSLKSSYPDSNKWNCTFKFNGGTWGTVYAYAQCCQ